MDTRLQAMASTTRLEYRKQRVNGAMRYEAHDHTCLQWPMYQSMRSVSVMLKPFVGVCLRSKPLMIVLCVLCVYVMYAGGFRAPYFEFSEAYINELYAAGMLYDSSILYVSPSHHITHT